MLVGAAGWGLLVLMAGKWRLRGLYALPLGFAAMVVVSAFLTSWDATAQLTAPVLALGAVAGLVAGRAALRGWTRPLGRWAWAAGAATLAGAAYVLPAALTGGATFSGFARIVDIGNQFDFTRYLVEQGRMDPPARDTSYLEVVTKTLDIGYPSGAQSVLGSFSALLQTDIPWLYQGFLGVVAAMGALAVYLLLAPLVASRPLRALGAGIALQANVLYGYGSVGGFKELTTASLLLLTAAVARDSLPERAQARAMLPLAVTASACLAAFNLAIVPWLGVMLAALFVISVLRARGSLRARLGPVAAWAAMAVATLIISAPTVWEALKLAPVAAAASGADRTAIADLGNLSAPMDLKAVGGVWISGDYRFPANGDTLVTNLGLGVVALLAVFGLVHALRRRDWGLLALSVASLVAFTYFARQTGPWIQLKAITMTSPVVLTLAFAGAGGLLASRHRPRIAAVAGWGLAAGVALLVLAGNALAYHYMTFAPTERMRDLERIGERFAGEGPTFYPAHDEYAEYFLREMDATAQVNPPGEGLGFPQLRSEIAVESFGYPFRADLDWIQSSWLQEFAMLVLPRDPMQSRPPANYDLVAQTRFHQVWRQVRPSADVAVRVPLAPEADPSLADDACAELVAAAEDAGASLRLAYVRRAPSEVVELDEANLSPNWVAEATIPGSILTYGPGRARAGFTLPEAGEYRVWLQGPYQRELRVAIDGRPFAAVEDYWSYPRRWTQLGTERLAAGAHSVTLERGGGTLEPGDGAADQAVGPIVFERLVSGRGDVVQFAPPSEAASLCEDREGLDWISLVRR